MEGGGAEEGAGDLPAHALGLLPQIAAAGAASAKRKRTAAKPLARVAASMRGRSGPTDGACVLDSRAEALKKGTDAVGGETLWRRLAQGEVEGLRSFDFPGPFRVQLRLST